MPRSQTIDILNDAYDMQRRLDWVLFSNENEHHGSESEWVPGDPLFDRPHMYSSHAQYIRPMFELMDYFHNNNSVYFTARCSECKVYWSGDEPCWVCGENAPDPLKFSEVGLGEPSWDYVYYTASDVEITTRTLYRPLRIDLDIQGFSDQVSIVQELLVYMREEIENSVGRAFENFRNVVLSTPRQYGRSGFRPWGVVIDEWADNYNTVLVNGIRIPRVIPTEPVIELPKFHFNSTYFDRPAVEIPQKSYPTSINPTRQRRPRRS